MYEEAKVKEAFRRLNEELGYGPRMGEKAGEPVLLAFYPNQGFRPVDLDELRALIGHAN